MSGSFDVLLRGKATGTAEVTEQGLYCHIRCRCSPEKKEVYRLWVRCGQSQLRLGILVPEGDRMVLETRIPAKKLTGEGLEFYLESASTQSNTAGKENMKLQYVPIYPDEPFAYLTRLKNAYLEIRSGKPGLVLKG